MHPIQVLIVDDSAVVRGLMAQALQSDAEIQIAGTAMHGTAALNFLRRNPVDVVVLDVEMPVLDGLTVLPQILTQYPHVRVIMASSLTQDGAETSVRALALGAAGCVAKPEAASVAASIEQLAHELVPLVKALRPAHHSSPESDASGEHSTHSSRPPHAGSTRKLNPQKYSGSPAIVVIGSSTGGPRALSAVLSALPQTMQLPIMIAQHMPPTFTPMLARHLGQDSGRPCSEATHGGLIERGHVYVAPGDYHVVIEKRGDRMVTTLNQMAPEHFCRPSVNPLFRSAADWYGSGVVAVMLTGMGDDGIEGTHAIAGRKGYIIAQDEPSSVVWGMPGAVALAGLAHEILPLSQIASAVARVCRQEVACR